LVSLHFDLSTISRMLKNIGLFCKRALQKRRISSTRCITRVLSLVSLHFDLSTISRMLKNIGLFCKRALQKRRISSTRCITRVLSLVSLHFDLSVVYQWHFTAKSGIYILSSTQWYDSCPLFLLFPFRVVSGMTRILYSFFFDFHSSSQWCSQCCFTTQCGIHILTPYTSEQSQRLYLHSVVYILVASVVSLHSVVYLFSHPTHLSSPNASICRVWYIYSHTLHTWPVPAPVSSRLVSVVPVVLHCRE